jgi:uncharacterized phage infection (PIP) family protein YhgE
MIRVFRVVSAVVLAANVAAPVSAQLADSPKSLDALLDQVEAVRVEENRQFEQRRNEFNAAAAAQQTTMMRQADENRGTLNAGVQKLSAQFTANEEQISKLNTQLREKAQSLGLAEMFSVARQAAKQG